MRSEESPSGGEATHASGTVHRRLVGFLRDDSLESSATLEATRLGRYELGRKLGRGGMGTVYEAWDTELARKVAIKAVPHDALGPLGLERFFREARAAARLDHPGVVSVLDVGRASVGEREETHYICMQLVEGESLAQTLARSRPRPAQVVKWLEEVARAVHHAHERNVLHRDLKPSNILIDESGRALVADFGLARGLSDVEGDPLAGPITFTGQILGTPSYMSPEQARGRTEELTAASDVFSLGVVLYECLTGSLPFQADNVAETLSQILQHDPIPLRTHRRDLSRDLETITLACLEKDSSRRFSSMEELADELARWLAGSPIRIRRATRVARLGRWILTRKRRVAALLLLVTFALLPTTVLVMIQEERSADLRSTLLYKDAETLLLVALEARRHGETRKLESGVEEVMRLADESLQSDPENAQAHLVRGWAARLSGRLDQAVLEFDAALEGAPGDPTALYQRGLTQVMLFHEGLTEARVAWDRQVSPGTSSSPSDSDLEILRPELVTLRGRVREDLSGLAGRSASDPGLAESARGLVELAGGDDGRARAHFARAVELDPEREEAWIGLVASTHQLGLDDELSPEEVLGVMDQAMSKNRGLEDLYLARSALHRWRANRTFWQEGSDARAFDEWARAEADATRAVELWPHGAREYVERAHVLSMWAGALLERGSREEGERLLARADADASRAIDTETGSRHGYLARGLVRWRLGEEKRKRGEDPTGDIASAIDDFSWALAGTTQFADAYLHRGLALESSGDWKGGHGIDPVEDYERAVLDFTAASRWERGRLAALFTRGNTYSSLGSWNVRVGADPGPFFADALADYSTVLDDSGDDVLAHVNAANVNWTWGEWKAGRGFDPTSLYEAALARAAEAIRKNDADQVAHFLLGTALSSLTRWRTRSGLDPREGYREAIAELTRATQLNPAYAKAFHNRGAVWLELGSAQEGGSSKESFDQAVADFARATELDTSYVEAFLASAAARFELGRWIRRHPADSGGADAIDTYRQGIADLDRALELDSDHIGAHVNRGNLLKAMGDLEISRGENPEQEFVSARAAYERAIEIDPESWLPLVNRGLLFESMGLTHQAVADYRAALDRGADPAFRLRVERLERASRE